MSWTPERVALLTQMWNEGRSSSQIAKALGGVTRNMVIGKVHRLGLRSVGYSAATQPAPLALDGVAQAQVDAMRQELAQTQTLDDLRSLLDGWLAKGVLRPHTPSSHT